jgi:cytochrome c peroxidase
MSHERALVAIVGLLVAGMSGCAAGDPEADTGAVSRSGQALLGLAALPNNLPIPNAGGAAATFSSDGFVDLENPFHVPQGANGRSCETCHSPAAGWSVRPIDVELMFAFSDGTHPIFNLLDANSPAADVTTREARHRSYSMLRAGLFRRSSNLAATAELEIIAVDDPLGAGGNTSRFTFFRRPLATANFLHTRNVGWHDQNTNASGDVTLGLDLQAKGNITGAQQGPAPTQALVDAIVGYEKGLWFAQSFSFGAGLLDHCGGRGGPELLSRQPFVDGRFDLFDAWIAGGGCARDPDRRRIARGQQLFNDKATPTGRTCRGCHNAANSGSNVAGVLFDVGASAASRRRPGMPLYTVRNKTTLEVVQTTDPGRAGSTGKWADLNRFKTPSMRGVAARAPYFHNGVAATLADVIHLYEEQFGFDFSPDEERDLVAFMNAL